MLVLAHLHRQVFDTTSPQFRPPSCRGKAIFRQALAELSPNFREKSPNTFLQNETYIINNKYNDLQCKFRHVYMNFRQNFSQKKIYFAISKKNFSRDC